MKKRLCLLLAAMLLSTLLPWPVTAAAAGEKELTILAYICGTNLESEEGEATDDIREMISSGIGNSDDVTLLLATGGASRWNRYDISSRSVQYYRVENNAPVLLKDAGKMSMGDAKTLSAFLTFGIAAAPAKRYALVLWDHGNGPVHGLCNDENYRDDGLTLDELNKGLTDGLKGNRLDIIGFDCCLMNCVDLCADLYGIADYSVVSQELVSGTGFDYDGWMGPVAADPQLSTEKIAMLMAQTYVEVNSRGREATTATMTVVDSGKMPEVMEAANRFSNALTSLTETNLAGVVRAREKLTSFGEFLDEDASDLVDVEDLCDAFTALLPQESAELKQAAQQAVCYNCTTSDIAAYAHGLSFFLPYKTVSKDKQEILNHYSGQGDSYSALATAMTSQVSSSGYAMTASSYSPGNFYSNYNDSFSGSFCDIWNGYYGDYCSFDDAYSACGGNIWSGLSAMGGSIWDGISDSSGIWSGYGQTEPAATPSVSGIWSGLGDTGSEPAATEPPAQAAAASAALNNIWAGLLNPGSDYYQPGEENQNVVPGISEAVTVEDALETAGNYFSSVPMNAQMIYSIQLNKEDLNHLATASGVLSREENGETIRLGNMGQTTVDWSTGLILSMFDGSWPRLGDQMARAEYLFGEENGDVRFVIPALINNLKMYLLCNYTAEGKTELIGATQGYDANGFAIRGSIPLQAGTTVYPLFTAVAADGTEREYQGSAIVIPEEGLELTWEKIPEGNYRYCFGLTDLGGKVHYTDSVSMEF